MTRINCIPAQELSRQHLVAEWRELPRVFRLAAAACSSGRRLKAPERYTLGAGHVTFFYTRLGFIRRRWQELRDEMLRRGYTPGFDTPPEFAVCEDWQRDWTPDADAISINRARIAERSAS